MRRNRTDKCSGRNDGVVPPRLCGSGATGCGTLQQDNSLRTDNIVDFDGKQIHPAEEIGNEMRHGCWYRSWSDRLHNTAMAYHDEPIRNAHRPGLIVRHKDGGDP